MKFSPEVHTPDALGAELAQIHDADRTARLGGSLGRAIIYGQVFGDPMHEFDQRGQSPLSASGKPRDIDVISNAVDAGTQYVPFSVDRSCFQSPFLNLSEQNGDWFLTAPHHSFAEPLHEDVVRPVYGETVFGIPSVTLPPQSLLALYGVRGQMRQKDHHTRGILRQVCDALPSQESLPNELYAPFADLTKLNMSSRYVRLQTVYREKVPEGTRSKLVPIIRRVKLLVG